MKTSEPKTKGDSVYSLSIELTALVAEAAKLEKKIKEVENKIRKLQIKEL